MRTSLLGFLCIACVAIGCAASAGGGADPASGAQADGGSSGGGDDVGVDSGAAAGDAARADAEAGDPDVCTTRPGGCPVLVSDTTANSIYALDTTGALITTFRSPVPGVTGVAHAPTRDGFWVVGNDDMVNRVGWNGKVTASFGLTGYSKANGSARGLGYRSASGGTGDLLVLVFTNGDGDDAYAELDPTSGDTLYSLAFYDSGDFRQGYWGIEADGDDRWTTRASPDTLEKWPPLSTTTPLAAITPRGIAKTPDGGFWIVDAKTKHIIEVTAAGTVVGSFSTPATDPGDISYLPAPQP